jgi:hypothetical protein
MHAEIQQQEREHVQQDKKSLEVVHKQPSLRLLQNQYTPPMENDLMFSHGFEREGSRTPPLFAYHQYSTPEAIVYPPYPQSQPYRLVSTAGDDYDCLAPVPVTLPSMMHFHEAIKREDDTLSPFSLCYQGLPPMEFPQSHGYDGSNPRDGVAHNESQKKLKCTC